MRPGRPRKIGQRFPGGKLRRNLPKPGKAAIYVIELSPGIVKIGLTQNPKERVTSLAVMREHPIALICCFWMDKAGAIAIERKVHRKLQKTSVHAHGEIYFLDAETAIAVIKTAIGKQDAEVVGVERLQSEKDLIFSGSLGHRNLPAGLSVKGQRRG